MNVEWRCLPQNRGRMNGGKAIIGDELIFEVNKSFKIVSPAPSTQPLSFHFYLSIPQHSNSLQQTINDIDFVIMRECDRREHELRLVYRACEYAWARALSTNDDICRLVGGLKSIPFLEILFFNRTTLIDTNHSSSLSGCAPPSWYGDQDKNGNPLLFLHNLRSSFWNPREFPFLFRCWAHYIIYCYSLQNLSQSLLYRHQR